MILSCQDDASRPLLCRCKKFHFHRHGSYFRRIANVVVYRFICTSCRLTISMLPSSCVPFKHYPVRDINPVLDGMFLDGRSGRYYERIQPQGIHASTAHRWRREFEQHCTTLATEGARRLGIAPLTGIAAGVFQKLKEHFISHQGAFFSPLQVCLCSRFPPLGIFRVLNF